MASESKSAIRALGEIALRVNNLNVMQRFYENDIGLELMKRFEHAAFFKIAEGYAGHTTILALFDRKADNPEHHIASDTSSFDHIAFTIGRMDYDSERQRLESRGLEVDVATHPWVRWRSMYVYDPEGNRVELVCFDESVEGV
ncbi:MAG: VOC family protein [Candidatus Zixiibacteriota bacterium]